MDPVTERDHGYALILVLWTLVLISIIAASVLHEARIERSMAEMDLATMRARWLADGAINEAILSFLDPTSPEHWKIDGSSRDITLGSQTVTVRVTSENGKIDLNAAPASLLAGLFEGQGMPATDAQNLSARIVAWRSPPPATAVDDEASRYMDAKRTYTPRYAPFRTVAELRLVLGMTDQLQDAIAPVLTVYTNTPNVDLGVATDSVLRALAGSGNNFAPLQLQARTQGNAAGVDRTPIADEPLLIEARVSVGVASADRSAVIRMHVRPDQPYQVLSWH